MVQREGTESSPRERREKVLKLKGPEGREEKRVASAESQLTSKTGKMTVAPSSASWLMRSGERLLISHTGVCAPYNPALHNYAAREEASFRRAMSILSICSIAFMTHCDLRGSLSPSSSPSALGMICQERPNLSFNQPHRDFWPPAESFSQSSSTSCCVSTLTNIETASVNLKCGPPFSTMNFWPSISKVAVMTEPFWPGPASP